MEMINIIHEEKFAQKIINAIKVSVEKPNTKSLSSFFEYISTNFAECKSIVEEIFAKVKSNEKFRLFINTTILSTDMLEVQEKKCWIQAIYYASQSKFGSSDELISIIEEVQKRYLKNVSDKSLLSNQIAKNEHLHPESLFMIMHSDEWKILYSIVGKDILQRMLLSYSILCKYPSYKAYLQIVGQPLCKPTKEEALNIEANDKVVKQRYLQRTKIFYSYYRGRKLGIFKKNIFNQKYTNTKIHAKKLVQDYIFRNKYKSPYSIQEAEFYKNNSEIIKTIEMYLEKAIFNQHKLKYQFLINYYCPLPPNIMKHLKDLEATFQSTPSQRQSIFKELFALCNSNIQVTNFVFHVIFLILPRDFLGPYNMKKLRKKIKQFISLNRFETWIFPTASVFLKYERIPWLNNVIQDAKKKASILEFIAVWIFNDLIPSIIRSFFYCTERQKDYSKIFYYRQELWASIIKMAIIDLKTNNQIEDCFDERILKEEETRKVYSLGKIRIIPKVDSIRAITTYNKNKKRKKEEAIQNNPSEIIHAILKNLKFDMIKQSYGFGVFDYKQIFEKLTKFVGQWNSQNCPELFWATLDLEKCYDNVPLEPLISQIQKNKQLISDTYYQYKMVLMKLDPGFEKSQGPNKNYFRTRTKLVAISHIEDNHLNLIKVGDFNSQNCICMVILNLKNQLISQIQFQNLIHFLNNNFVKLGRKSYKMVKGVPQGLNVSYLLSSLFYSCAEKFAFEDLFKQIIKNTLVMRLTDDYIVISSNKEIAKSIVERLVMLKDLGLIKINVEKGKTNFKCSLKNCEENLQQINWVGITFDTKTCEIIPFYKCPIEKLQMSINLNYGGEEDVVWLWKKAQMFLKSNINYFLLSSINSTETCENLIIEGCRYAGEKLVETCKRLVSENETKKWKESIKRMGWIIIRMIILLIRYAKEHNSNIGHDHVLETKCIFAVMDRFSDKKSIFSSIVNSKYIKNRLNSISQMPVKHKLQVMSDEVNEPTPLTNSFSKPIIEAENSMKD